MWTDAGRPLMHKTGLYDMDLRYMPEEMNALITSKCVRPIVKENIRPRPYLIHFTSS
jgi:hypothetical protein